MAFRPRALRRVLVGGAVVALSTVFLAPLATASDSSSSLDPPGVDVPGWEAAKVSGEATGCHSEIEANVTLTLAPNVEGATAGSQDATSALAQAGITLPPNTPGYLKDLLDGLTQKVAEVNAQDTEGDNDALFHAEAGPVPTVELPWQGGGPVSEDEGDCTLDLFSVIHIPLATDLKVETQGAIGPAGYAHTESESSDNQSLLYGGNDKISTECLATLKDIEATTDIEGGQYLDLVSTIPGDPSGIQASLKDLPEHPKKNDKLVDFEFHYVPQTPPTPVIDIEYSLTANEQKDGDKAVTVTGLHSELSIHLVLDGPGPTLATIDISADGIRDQSHCDIHPVAVAQPVVVEPKFTG